MSRLSSTFTNLLLTVPLVAVLTGSMAAQAQTGTTATVPFEFSANNVHVPAGTYKVQLLSERLCVCGISRRARTNACLFGHNPNTALKVRVVSFSIASDCTTILPRCGSLEPTSTASSFRSMPSKRPR